MSWKDKTCEKCVYRISKDCRRFPPSYFLFHKYPEVMWSSLKDFLRDMDKRYYEKACAEFKDREGEDDNTLR